MRPVKTIEMQACQFSKFIAFEYSGSCFIFMRRNMKWNLAQHLASISVDQLRFSEFLDLLGNVAHASRGGAVWKEKTGLFQFYFVCTIFSRALTRNFFGGYNFRKQRHQTTNKQKFCRNSQAAVYQVCFPLFSWFC